MKQIEIKNIGTYVGGDVFTAININVEVKPGHK